MDRQRERRKPGERSARDAEEERILRLLRQEDADAVAQLQAVFGERIYGLVLKILRNEENAKEVVQETILTVWKKWPTFKGNARFSSWIYRIAANEAYMRLRRERGHDREMRLAEDADDWLQGRESPLLNHPETPEELIERQELRRLILQEVLRLSSTYRLAYLLKEVDGLTIQEVGEILDISESAVKSRVHRARRIVRRRLAEIIRR